MICCRRLMIVLISLTSVGCSAASRHPQVKNSPYSVRGVRYVPFTVEEARRYEGEGIASWYGPKKGWLWFGGGSEVTASGEEITSRSLSAAHRLLPLPSTVEVTNLQNGRRATLRVNDRGPFVGDRLLDVSSRAAKKLGFKDQGLTNVRVRTIRVGD